jgi:class 3 adenylate cyclase
MVRAWRELLPGDPNFGDPLSTTGNDPAQVLARRAYALNDSRWGIAGEMSLAALQLAAWLSEDVAPRNREDDVAILFTDLVNFSSWALDAGDTQSLDLLRRVDAAVSAAVEDCGGQVIKRLGDGSMAVFTDASLSLDAARNALQAGAAVDADGYTPELRAGLHYGTPRPIGSDYIGIDVNVAARLCEAARGNEVLISEAVRAQLDGQTSELERRPVENLDGVPTALKTYAVTVSGPKERPRRASRSNGRGGS